MFPGIVLVISVLTYFYEKVFLNSLVIKSHTENRLLKCALLSLLVELSSSNVHLEDSTGPELWKHSSHQASRADPPDGAPRWIAHQRGLMSGSSYTVGLIQDVG